MITGYPNAIVISTATVAAIDGRHSDQGAGSFMMMSVFDRETDRAYIATDTVYDGRPFSSHRFPEDFTPVTAGSLLLHVGSYLAKLRKDRAATLDMDASADFTNKTLNHLEETKDNS